MIEKQSWCLKRCKRSVCSPIATASLTTIHTPTRQIVYFNLQRQQWIEQAATDAPNRIHKAEVLEFLELLEDTRKQRRQRKQAQLAANAPQIPELTIASPVETATTSARTTESLTPLAAEALLHEQRHHYQYKSLPKQSVDTLTSEEIPFPAYSRWLLKLNDVCHSLGESSACSPADRRQHLSSLARAIVLEAFPDAVTDPLAPDSHEAEREQEAPEHVVAPTSVEALPLGSSNGAVGNCIGEAASESSAAGGAASLAAAAEEPVAVAAVATTDTTGTSAGDAAASGEHRRSGDATTPESGQKHQELQPEHLKPGGKDFVSRLYHPAAADIVELIKAFLKGFSEIDVVELAGVQPDPDVYDDDDEDGDGGDDDADRDAGSPTRRPSSSLTATSAPAATALSTSASQRSMMADQHLDNSTSEDTFQLPSATPRSAADRQQQQQQLQLSRQSTASPSSLSQMSRASAAAAATAGPAAGSAGADGKSVAAASSSLSVAGGSGDLDGNWASTLHPIRSSELQGLSSSGGGGGAHRGVDAAMTPGRRPVPATPSTAKTPKQRMDLKRQRSKGDPAAAKALGPAPQDRVRAFLTRCEDAMRVHPLWRHDTSEEWEETRDHLESFLMGRLYPAVFGAHPLCDRRDLVLHDRMASLSFITFRNLDLADPSPYLAPGWKLAQAALRDIDKYPSPGDKLACVMNACRIISTLLTAAGDERAAQEGKGSGKGGVGADEFLPALIYTVIKACPNRLYSNLRYIGEYRNPSRLMSEQGYFYTNVLSAVAFARRVRPEQLSMSHAEFEEAVATSLALAQRRRMDEVARGMHAEASAKAALTMTATGSGSGSGGDDEHAPVQQRLVAMRISPSSLVFTGLHRHDDHDDDDADGGRCDGAGDRGAGDTAVASAQVPMQTTAGNDNSSDAEGAAALALLAADSEDANGEATRVQAADLQLLPASTLPHDVAQAATSSTASDSTAAGGSGHGLESAYHAHCLEIRHALDACTNRLEYALTRIRHDMESEPSAAGGDGAHYSTTGTSSDLHQAGVDPASIPQLARLMDLQRQLTEAFAPLTDRAQGSGQHGGSSDSNDPGDAGGAPSSSIDVLEESKARAAKMMDAIQVALRDSRRVGALAGR